jgi:hypothetical protein
MWVPRTGAKEFSSSGDLWRTPSHSDVEGGVLDMERARREGLNPKLKLRDHAANWPTARANSAMAAAVNPDAKFPNLETVVARWQTPTSGDGGQYNRGKGRTDELLLGGQSQELRSHLDQPTSTHGEQSSPSDQTSHQPSPKKKRLNYRFVEWLMGFPEGWL